MSNAVFVASRRQYRKSAFVSAALAVVSLIAAFVLFQVNVLVGVAAILPLILGIIFAVICIMVLRTMAGGLPQLRLDEAGLVVIYRRQDVRIPWSQAEAVRIVRRPPHESKSGWLMVWLGPGVAVPKLLTHIMAWNAELSALRILDMDLFPGSVDQISAAIRQYAGGLWSESREPL